MTQCDETEPIRHSCISIDHADAGTIRLVSRGIMQEVNQCPLGLNSSPIDT